MSWTFINVLLHAYQSLRISLKITSIVQGRRKRIQIQKLIFRHSYDRRPERLRTGPQHIFANYPTLFHYFQTGGRLFPPQELVPTNVLRFRRPWGADTLVKMACLFLFLFFFFGTPNFRWGKCLSPLCSE